MQYNDAGKIIEIFRGLSFEAESGSRVAIVGESGVGKTTLLNILGMLETPVSGEVYIGEQRVTDWQQNGDLALFRGRSIGFVFQFHYLLPEFDAVENVSMPLLIQGTSRKEAAERAISLLQRVGLGHRLEHRPSALSGGEQQRVAIARALAAKPGVVLADEPTGNLDVATAHEVQKLLLDMQREEQSTLIIVTHSLDLARQMDRIVELTPQGMVNRT